MLRIYLHSFLSVSAQEQQDKLQIEVDWNCVQNSWMHKYSLGTFILYSYNMNIIQHDGLFEMKHDQPT